MERLKRKKKVERNKIEGSLFFIRKEGFVLK
jgi:hypothetical protein